MHSRRGARSASWGGKSTFFGALGEAVCASGQSYAMLSSDVLKKGLDASVSKAIVDGTHVVGYDKNIPDVSGLNKLLKSLSGVNTTRPIRVVLVLPSALEPRHRELFWARVRARPAEHVALTVHEEGGEEGALQVFERVFWHRSCQWRQVAEGLPGALALDVFDKAGEEFSAGMQQLAAQLNDFAVPHLTVFQSAAELGSEAASPGAAGWAAAELSGGCGLHVTLVPPRNERSPELPRRAAVEALRGHVGVEVNVVCTRYHRAILRADRDHGLCFWEVDRLEGLETSALYEPQRSVYHVTDVASITRTAKPKDALSAMHQLRGSGDCESQWEIDTWEWPLSATANVVLH
eukprot:TRINITY_DN10466_c0_g1_i1.p1 TRINITY_DN10466_c0_g1~~TRINITY_DN10466_c0_g1_i1.p1  ORF type:complete len:349 (+),score=67.86 TRINITY_DN10466_c0_g1_i1:214-1260(+)